MVFLESLARRPLAEAAIENTPSSPQWDSKKVGSNEEIEQVKNQHVKIETALRSLETMAQAFKERVEGIATEFEELRENVMSLHQEYEALEVDYHHAVQCVREEKDTVASYAGMLANAQIEVELLQQVVPAEELPCAFSQARPW